MSKNTREIQPVGLFAATWALLTSMFWGGNAVATSFAVDAIPPIAAAGIRFALATAVMLIWCRIEGSGLGLNAHQRRPAIILGVLLFVQIATFNIGVSLSNSSHGVMLVNTVVFWVLIIEHFYTKAHRLTWRKTIGVLIASIGTMILFATSTSQESPSNPDLPTLSGDLVLLASSLILGVKIVYTRHAVLLMEPGKLIFWHDLIGVLLFFLWSSATESIDLTKIGVSAGIALLYQGFIVGGLCFAIQARLLQRHSASQIAIFGFAAPLFGILLAGLMRQDPMSPWLFTAACCVAVGIVIVNLSPKKSSQRVSH